MLLGACLAFMLSALGMKPILQPPEPFFPIDSHLHVWSNGVAPFPLASAVPADLKQSQAEDLVKLQEESGVGGALLVQPINHLYDHSYILSVMQNNQFGHHFKGMCLANPTISVEEGVQFLISRKAEGFVGVRFNPYLWTAGEAMSDERGSTLYVF